MFILGECNAFSGDRHTVLVAPDHELQGIEEKVIWKASNEEQVVIMVSLDAYLHLIATGALSRADEYAFRLMNAHIGPEVREFFASRTCPQCWKSLPK